ncbi:BREX system Lon protease-like protein BrxL [uncultured Thiohalocapsa sp.]|mgnify:CR=1 FL=1|uniref:BREX system Lon protease-like protein BrxL n=1 Tax=uncultured Thiohalocapsa sp. TaxID=768990 RepID=UPI0025FDBC70|nr:BREX system Lon protease-like protein BrxL [uncultured Thiohalocapsa sp.]
MSEVNDTAAQDALDRKLNAVFAGKVVRKDLLHRIKKGTNVPTFVLEFLLARYCASDEPAEIASQRIAVGERFYRDNERLLEGGIWAEVVVAHNDVDADNDAFYVEDLSPIQLSRFKFDAYGEGRAAFTRDEWLDVVLRSVGLEPSRLDRRRKLHFIARLAPLVEANFNFIELGPRGTGKSYFFSEFSPYSTLISGGQATKAVLFYNNARSKIGLVGFWDTVAFDEVGGIKVKDPDTIQILKDYMANGRFSRGVEVIADASMAFVGNIDQSIEQIVNSTEYDLFQPLPPQFDLAVMDRFACYLPGWEMPKTGSAYLTDRYGLITDYLAEAFHYQLKHTNRFDEVSKRIRLGRNVEGRDEKGIKKTVSAFLKILHPLEPPSDEEFDEYVAYAVEGRRRIKEQMNKRKPDDEFARIDLAYLDAEGNQVTVHCPETRNAPATLEPMRRRLSETAEDAAPDKATATSGPPAEVAGSTDETTPAAADGALPERVQAEAPATAQPQEQHFTIHYGATGYTYDAIIGPYLAGARAVEIEDPYIRARHQIGNFVRFCEAVVKQPGLRRITLTTSCDEHTDLKALHEAMEALKQSLLEIDVVLDVRVNEHLHDREIRLDNGWCIKIGRGLDFYQKPDSWYAIGANDFSLRPCLETKVDIYRRASGRSQS